MSELIFIGFWSAILTPCQRGVWEKLKLPKIGKRCLKLSFFLWFTHWWNQLCQIDWLGVGKDIKGILKRFENELTLSFQCYILIRRKCPPKALFEHTVPAPSTQTYFIYSPTSAYVIYEWSQKGLCQLRQHCQEQSYPIQRTKKPYYRGKSTFIHGIISTTSLLNDF